jgi:PIN domain nuclease of toxin-antitoxin system
MGEKLLLDTHALIWWTFEPQELSGDAFAAIEDAENRVFVSAVTAMEIATKVRKGRLERARPLASGFTRQVEESEFEPLSITCEHAERAGGLEFAHRDPWDRLLIAQAQIERMILISNERLFDTFGVTRLW